MIHNAHPIDDTNEHKSEWEMKKKHTRIVEGSEINHSPWGIFSLCFSFHFAFGVCSARCLNHEYNSYDNKYTDETMKR